MSRPKYKTGEKDARGKIADAFWELISERPYTEISVLDIVRKAKLNKNTFYYHYNGIDEMSKDIVEQSLDPAAFKRMLSSVGSNSNGSEYVADDQLNKSFERFGLIAGDNSSPALKTLLRDAISEAWGEMFGIDVSVVSNKERASYEFALGGIMAVIALQHNDIGDFTLKEAMTSDLQEDVVRHLKLIGERTQNHQA